MKNKVLFVLSLLFGLNYVNAGMNKFFNYLPTPTDLPEALASDNQALMEISWLIPLVATIEIIGGALFIPRRYRALGAIVILPISVGVLLVHSTVAPSGLPVALIIVGINLWVIIENRSKYLPLVRG